MQNLITPETEHPTPERLIQSLSPKEMSQFHRNFHVTVLLSSLRNSSGAGFIEQSLQLPCAAQIVSYRS